MARGKEGEEDGEGEGKAEGSYAEGRRQKDEFIFPLSPLLPYLPYLPCTPALLLLPQDCFGGRGTR